MKNKVLTLLLITYCLSLVASPVLAKKKLGSAVSTGIKTTTTRPTAGVTASARLTADRRNLSINFSNLSIAGSVSYLLTYNANGIPQGVGGTISAEGDATTRTLYFGTCSKSVCTAHRNITGMKLQITSNLKSGKKVIKTFRVKV
jgi:hypothetical protein